MKFKNDLFKYFCHVLCKVSHLYEWSMAKSSLKNSHSKDLIQKLSESMIKWSTSPKHCSTTWIINNSKIIPHRRHSSRDKISIHLCLTCSIYDASHVKVQRMIRFSYESKIHGPYLYQRSIQTFCHDELWWASSINDSPVSLIDVSYQRNFYSNMFRLNHSDVLEWSCWLIKS